MQNRRYGFALTLSLAVTALLCAVPQARAVDITASGGWSPAIGATNLRAGAGSNLNPSYESDGFGALSITNTSGSSNQWRVDVRRSDTCWHTGLSLSIRRTGDGAGAGGISGGTTYVPVGATDSAFFGGTGDRTGIEVELKLSGMSVTIPPNTYSTTVVCTVVDLL